jgi:hypothetical protein
MHDVNTWMFEQIQTDIYNLQQQILQITQKSERSETVGGFASFAYADAPRAADGGMSDGSSYIDALWINNGRKPGEGVGNGTGVLAVYSAAIDDWIDVNGYAVVTV